MTNNPQQNYINFLETLNTWVLDQSNFSQEKTLKRILELENKFRMTLSKTSKGIKVYKSFIKFIKDEEKNILSARVFFREREDTFSKKIPNHIRNDDAVGLSKFNINYKFIHWSLQRCEVPSAKVLKKIYDEIITNRQDLAEQCLPLIINRSRLFQRKTRRYDQDAVEFIQSATEGFMSAIDKYVPQKTDKFRGVAVGWIQSKLMADYSDPFLKLSLKEKRILYRANIAMYRNGERDIAKVLDFVKESYPKVTIDELKELLNSTNTIKSIDVAHPDLISFSSADYDANEVESGIINRELHSKLYEGISKLSIFERKIIKLMGGLS